MKRTLPLLLLAGCVSDATQADWDALDRDVNSVAAPVPEAPAPAEVEGKLEVMLETARARNPALRQALQQARAALERVGEAAAWEDVVLKFTVDDGVVRSPLSVDRAASLMVGLLQMIPALGKIDARTEAAVQEGRAALEMYRAAERDVARDVRRAFAEYDEATRLRELHSRHEKILADFEKVADAKYKAGTAVQSDVLKAQIELARLRAMIADNERGAVTAVARLNQLMHRPGDATLGPPPAAEPAPESFDLNALLKNALTERPEMRAAQATLEAARAQQRLAGVEATVPQFDVEALYGFVSGDDDVYDAGFSMNLPWLNSGRAARERAAGRTRAASEDALLALADGVAYEVRAGVAEAEAARKIAELYRTEILERARQAVEVTRKGYENNTVGFLDLLDAERSHRDAEIEYARSVARVRLARAILERAVGR